MALSQAINQSISSSMSQASAGVRTPLTIEGLLAEAYVRYQMSNLTHDGLVVSQLDNSGTSNSEWNLAPSGGAGQMLYSRGGSIVSFNEAGGYIHTPAATANDVNGDFSFELIGAVYPWATNSIEICSKFSTFANSTFVCSVANAPASPDIRLSVIEADTEYILTSNDHGLANNAFGSIAVEYTASTGTANFYVDTAGGETWSAIGSPTLGVARTPDSSTAGVIIGGGQYYTKPKCSFQTFRLWKNNSRTGNPDNEVRGIDYNGLGDTQTITGQYGEVWTMQNECAANPSTQDAVQSFNKEFQSIGAMSAGTPTGVITTQFTVGAWTEAVGGNEHLYDGGSGGRQIILNSAGVIQGYQGTGFVSTGVSNDKRQKVYIGEFRGDATSKITVVGNGSATGSIGANPWGFPGLTVYVLGGGGAQPNGFRLHEHICFNRALNEAELNLVRDHLITTYGAQAA